MHLYSVTYLEYHIIIIVILIRLFKISTDSLFVRFSEVYAWPDF